MNKEGVYHLRIKTPEGITFSQQIASPVSRFYAWIIDLLCILTISATVQIPLHWISAVSADVAQAVFILAYFVISIGYGIATEWFWRGQTLGKRIIHLRVVDAHGLRLQFNQVVIRNLLRFADSLPFLYLIGGITCLASRQGQRLGDIAANTVVIHIPKISSPDLEQILPGKFNSLREFPHLAARLRQRVSPAEAALALQALLRRDQLSPEGRLDLFQDFASHFRGLVAFPSEAVDGITDEQFIRNVVDILYRSKPGLKTSR